MLYYIDNRLHSESISLWICNNQFITDNRIKNIHCMDVALVDENAFIFDRKLFSIESGIVILR